MNVLHLDSSILGEHSVSRQLTREVVEALRLGEPSIDLHYRDLVADPVPVSDGALLAAKARPAAERSAAEQALVAQAEAVLAEFVASDLLVIGAPMYNFSIPSQLKAWVDLIAVAGVTFKYGPNGAEGLMGGKRAVIVATAGGQHDGQASGAAHAQYLKLLLAFLGVRDVQIVTAQGLAMGAPVREPALSRAREQIAELAPR